MTYLSDKKRKTSRAKYVFFLVFLFVLIYFWVGIRGFIRENGGSIAFTYYGAKRTVTYVPELVHTFFSSKQVLVDQKHALELQVASLENEFALQRVAVSVGAGTENNDEASTTSTRIEITPTIMMYPLMRDVTTLYSTVLLSKGREDGVINDALVYLRGRKLVCKIREVSSRTSVCTLLTGYGERTDGAFGSTTISLLGDGGNTYIGDVVRDSTIKEGDMIYYKGDPSMTLGTVVYVARDMQAAFAKVYVRGVYSEGEAYILYTDQ